MLITVEPFEDEEKPRRSVHDLEKTFNAYGREIFVEEWDAGHGKPKVWYEFNDQRILIKHERRPAGIFTSRLGKSHYL